MTEAFICDFARTPIGRYAGALKDVRTDDLAAHPIRVLKERNAGVDWADLDDCYMGLCQPGGRGQPECGPDGDAAGRAAGERAGLDGQPAVRGPGWMRWGRRRGRSVRGEAGLMLAGGVESMTRAPFVQGKATEAFARAAEDL